MYKVNINKIRDVIVQLIIRPKIIREYDKHVTCVFVNNDDYSVLIFDLTDERVIITYDNGEQERVLISDIEYMNIVISDFASRNTTS